MLSQNLRLKSCCSAFYKLSSAFMLLFSLYSNFNKSFLKFFRIPISNGTKQFIFKQKTLFTNDGHQKMVNQIWKQTPPLLTKLSLSESVTKLLISLNCWTLELRDIKISWLGSSLMTSNIKVERGVWKFVTLYMKFILCLWQFCDKGAEGGLKIPFFHGRHKWIAPYLGVKSSGHLVYFLGHC